jgi:hypothetical protein
LKAQKWKVVLKIKVIVPTCQGSSDTLEII